MNDHRINLKQALLKPGAISVIVRTVCDGRTKDHVESVWLIGKEGPADGYMIVMREDGTQFGLASSGFAEDKHPVLSGWYGTLKSAFLSM